MVNISFLSNPHPFTGPVRPFSLVQSESAIPQFSALSQLGPMLAGSGALQEAWGEFGGIVAQAPPATPHPHLPIAQPLPAPKPPRPPIGPYKPVAKPLPAPKPPRPPIGPYKPVAKPLPAPKPPVQPTGPYQNGGAWG